MATGHVYILLNASLGRDILKIGMTTRSPEERARELSSTGLPTPFIVAHSAPVGDCAQAEAMLHHSLDRYRMAANREFFNISLKQAIAELDLIAERFPEREPEPEDLHAEFVGKDDGPGSHAERGWFRCRMDSRVLVVVLLEPGRFELLDRHRVIGEFTLRWLPGGEVEVVGLPPDELTDDELATLEARTFEMGVRYDYLG